MKAVAIKTFGGPEGLSVVELPAPEPGSGQVRIAVEAIGVGGVDALIRSGSLSAWGFREGLVPGSEVAGTVVAVGPDTDRTWIGQRVWAFTGLGGGYAEQATAAVEDVVPLPPGLSAAGSVTLGSSGVVAHFGLAHAHFRPGESVLVRGAAGSIGILTVHLAAQGGASAVAVTTSSAERGELLRKVGATHVLDRSGRATHAPDRSGGARSTTSGAGAAPSAYDVIIDVVAGPDVPSFLGMLRPNGRLVAVGAITGPPPAELGTALMANFRKSLSFATFSADTVPPADRRTVRAEQFAAAADGQLPIVIHEQLPLDDAVLAHRKLQAGEVLGRIVLVP
ncbi:NADPH:quinone reductase-like Zn-dependent oxidoreductase [Kribbella aluminosa]|uniref:NADPH:quinone reductase-like Zn-dependent oxidoreductase n=1 Tax=Kribbella aluminosa TaxID=416017 RepID=A0ABS4ULG9_9ACTN|nr:zinc-binding dehydrogenase [Kribbella aluminosa]MBP2352507.1 NADPH:quinone reductase-like Zn-dependent oxidoreductase [Kribbella aluminosa]